MVRPTEYWFSRWNRNGSRRQTRPREAGSRKVNIVEYDFSSLTIYEVLLMLGKYECTELFIYRGYII